MMGHADPVQADEHLGLKEKAILDLEYLDNN